MNLSTYFSEVAAAGWRPLDPCTDERELARLEATYVASGDCMSPILRIGDTLYFDRAMPARSGDLVVFRLSQRGCDALNSAGAYTEPWIVGGPYWVKLLSIPPGSKTGFLLAAGGDLVTASFFSSEVPTDDPPIWPIRNVRRNGRLLFNAEQSESPLVPRRGVLAATFAGLALAGCDFGGTEIKELPPDVEPAAGDTAQVGANAVSQIISSFSNSVTNLTAAVGGTNPATATILSVAILTTGAPMAIDAYCPLSGGHTASGTSGASSIVVVRDGTPVSSSSLDVAGIINTASAAITPMTLSLTDTPAAGTHTYAIYASITASGAAGQAVTLSISEAFLKIREIKK